MQKKNNLNSKTRKTTNHRQEAVHKWMIEYIDLQGTKLEPVADAVIEKIAEDLINWSDLPDSIMMNKFFRLKKIPHERFHEWKFKYPVLMEAYLYAKEAIKERKEEGAIVRRYDAGFTLHSLTKHDEDWKDYIKWKTSLTDSSKDNTKFVFEFPNITTKEGSETPVKDTQEK